MSFTQHEAVQVKDTYCEMKLIDLFEAAGLCAVSILSTHSGMNRDP